MAIPLAEDQPTLKLTDVAQALGKSHSTIKRLARTGKMPVPMIRVGNSWVVRTTDMRKLLGLDEHQAAS